MGIVYKQYPEYAVIDGVEVFSISTVAEIVGKSVQTVRLWDRWSEELSADGEERLIPECIRVGGNGVRCWTEYDIQLILEFSKNLKYGDIAKFSRNQWKAQAATFKRDLSTEARTEKRLNRRRINAEGKKKMRLRKARELIAARGSMLKAVRKRARNLYDSVNY